MPVGVRVIICEGCRANVATAVPKGAALAESLREILDGVADVTLAECMNVCSKPVTVAFRATGKAAYLFAGVDADRQIEELATFAKLYASAEGGIVEDARPIGDLRFCLIGRIPA